MSAAGSSSSGSKKAPSKEEIVEQFNQLRQDQRYIVQQMSKIEQDKAEHLQVMEAMNQIDKDRVCYRNIGGVLVERTVGEVLPALQANTEKLAGFVEKLNEQMIAKGKEIGEYREKYNIRIRGEGEPVEDDKASGDKSGAKPAASGVLVS